MANLTLLEKLLEIRKATKKLTADTQNTAQGFKYVKSSVVLGEVRDLMNTLGVLLIPNVTKTELHHKDIVKGKMHLTEIWMDMIWISVEDPNDKLSVAWYAQGTDQHEKGVGKAYTYAEKFFILKFFNIPTDKDDPDGASGKTATPRTTKVKAKSNGGPPLPTDKQWEFIKTLGNKAHITEEETRELVKWVAGNKPFTVKEASELIDNFDTVLGQFLDQQAKAEEAK